jgi:hypothetical protein
MTIEHRLSLVDAQLALSSIAALQGRAPRRVPRR